MAGEVFPKLGPHVAHFLAKTLFKTSLYALDTATWRYGYAVSCVLAISVARSKLAASQGSGAQCPFSYAVDQVLSRCSQLASQAAER